MSEPEQHPEHGMTTEVYCEYVKIPYQGDFKKLLTDQRQQKMIKLLVYQGKVTDILCHHYREGGVCSATSNYCAFKSRLR